MSQQPNMEEILIDYLDGTLDATRRRAVETLLKHDAKLRKSLRAMRQVRGALRDLPIEPMPAAAASSLQDQLRPPAEPSIPLYSRPWLIRLAAAFAIAVTAGLVIWSALPSPSPMSQHIVAMDVATPKAIHTEAVAMRRESGAAGMADAGNMEPTLATKGATDALQLRGGEVAAENEPTLVVVVADDIGGTERQIRNLLTLNNINYESVPANSAQRDEAAKEVAVSGKAIADAAPALAAPAPAQARADIEKSEVTTARQATAAPAAAAPSAMAAGAAPAGPAAPPALSAPAATPAQFAQGGGAAGAGRGGPGMASEAQHEMPPALASAEQTTRQLAERRSPAATGRTASEPYGMVVARNVTPDQLGRIRSGLRDASRSGNMRVVDPSADRFPQMPADRNQAMNRTQQADSRQQLQKQNTWQYSNSQAMQNTQEQEQLALQTQNGPQRPISYSPRYDVTIVVQSEDAANAATLPTQASPATMPAATAPSTAPANP